MWLVALAEEGARDECGFTGTLNKMETGRQLWLVLGWSSAFGSEGGWWCCGVEGAVINAMGAGRGLMVEYKWARLLGRWWDAQAAPWWLRRWFCECGHC